MHTEIQQRTQKYTIILMTSKCVCVCFKAVSCLSCLCTADILIADYSPLYTTLLYYILHVKMRQGSWPLTPQQPEVLCSTALKIVPSIKTLWATLRTWRTRTIWLKYFFYISRGCFMNFPVNVKPFWPQLLILFLGKEKTHWVNQYWHIISL